MSLYELRTYTLYMGLILKFRTTPSPPGPVLSEVVRFGSCEQKRGSQNKKSGLEWLKDRRNARSIHGYSLRPTASGQRRSTRLPYPAAMRPFRSA
jgi:hypothetical protein